MYIDIYPFVSITLIYLRVLLVQPWEKLDSWKSYHYSLIDITRSESLVHSLKTKLDSLAENEKAYTSTMLDHFSEHYKCKARISPHTYNQCKRCALLYTLSILSHISIDLTIVKKRHLLTLHFNPGREEKLNLLRPKDQADSSETGYQTIRIFRTSATDSARTTCTEIDNSDLTF